jgi:hypothetical protein
MTKWQEYRRFAASCLEMARATGDQKQTLRLLEMAQLWSKLAERTVADEKEAAQEV